MLSGAIIAKKITRVFNVKNFIILSILVFFIIIAVFAMLDKKNKEDFEMRKRQVKENPMMVYTTGKSLDFSECMKYCDMKIDNIDCIALGLDMGGKYLERYYVDDATVIEKVINLLENVTFNIANDSTHQKGEKYRWEIILIVGDKEYALCFSGYSTEYENVDITSLVTCCPEYSATAKEWYPNMMKLAGEVQLLFDEEMYDNILNIYNEDIKNINIDIIEAIKEKKSRELTDYFRYKHEISEVHNYHDDNGIFRVTIAYRFPIENTKCYMEVEKHNEGDRYNNETNSFDDKPNHDIIRVEVYNEAGEYIDLFECTNEELEEFIK